MDEERESRAAGRGGADGHLPEDTVRADLDAALRHLHFMGMQTKHDLVDASSRLYALLEELVANGQIDLRRFEERRLRLREQEEARLQKRVHVQVSDVADKYALSDLPQIDCQKYLHLCQARCCKLVFPLSFQDLDERIVQWDYARPYVIRQNAEGRCVHQDSGNRHCTVYEYRPSACRLYDCRNDRRIWLNFEEGILAPEQETADGEPMQAEGPDAPDGQAN